MPAPVLGPELGGGSARVISERHGWPSAPRHAAHELDLALHERAQVVALGHEGPAGLPEPSREGGIVEDSPKALRQLVRAARVEKEPRLAIGDERSVARTVRGDARHAEGHGLEKDLGMSLRERGEDEDVRRSVHGGELRLLHYSRELDLDVARPSERLEIGEERSRTDHDVESPIADVRRSGHNGLEVLLRR